MARVSATNAFYPCFFSRSYRWIYDNKKLEEGLPERSEGKTYTQPKKNNILTLIKICIKYVSKGLKKMKRKMVNLPDDIAEYVENESKIVGIPQNSVIILALKEMKEKKEVLKSMNNVESWLSQLAELKKDYTE